MWCHRASAAADSPCCPSWFDEMWMTDGWQCHPGALRHVAGDGQTLGSGRACWLWLLRLALSLVLGSEALPGLFRGRDADHVVPGEPQTRRTPGPRRAAGA